MNGNGKAPGGAPAPGSAASAQAGAPPQQNVGAPASLPHFYQRPQQQQQQPRPEFHVAFQGAPPPQLRAPQQHPHAHPHAHQQHEHAIKHYSQQQQQLFSFVGQHSAAAHAHPQHPHQHPHQHHQQHGAHGVHGGHAAHPAHATHAAHATRPHQPHRAPSVYSGASPPAAPVYMPIHSLQQNHQLYGFGALAGQYPQQQQPRQPYPFGQGAMPSVLSQQPYSSYIYQNQQAPQYYLQPSNGGSQPSSLATVGGSLAVVPPGGPLAMVSQGSIGPNSGAPLHQHPPAPTPQAPPERTRRPFAIDVRDPDTGRDVMEDIYKSDPPSSEPVNKAIKEEFYRRVQDAIKDANERPSGTPIVSAISDSPEIVPKTGGPPKSHRPPEAVAPSSESPVSDASSPAASTSPSPSSSPSPVGVRDEPSAPAVLSPPPRAESPPAPAVVEDSPPRPSPSEKLFEAPVDPDASEVSPDKVADGDANEKPLDLPLIEDESDSVRPRSPPVVELPEDVLEVNSTSVKIIADADDAKIDKLKCEEKLNSIGYVPSVGLNCNSVAINVDNDPERDNGAVSPENVPDEPHELKSIIEETSTLTDRAEEKFSEMSVSIMMSEIVEKGIDVNDNVSTKIDRFDDLCEIVGDKPNGNVDVVIENVNNVDGSVHEPTDVDNKLSNSIDSNNLKNESNEMNDVEKKSLPRYPYKDGQWSPFNTSGKKCYDADFLLALRQDPLSMKKPENIEKLDLIISDGAPKQKFNNNQGNMRNDSSNTFSNIRQDFLFPDFAKGITRGVMPGRKSQQGKSGSKNNNNPSSMPSKPQVINISLSLREDVKLNVSENAWKPKRLKTAAEEADESKQTQELYKKFRSILNKLTPEKFDKLIKQILELDINTEERFKGVIDLVFEKAISEPSFALTYASLCHHLKQLNVPNAAETDTANFRYLIINKCQMEFEKASADETANLLKEKEIDECDDPEKKKEMKRLFEEEERRMRRRSVGNVRFIGELYKQGMISVRIMIGCIENLIKKLEEETLECLCKLLTTIGKKVESEPGIDLQPYFSNMQQIVNTKDKRVSSRIRFMLQDVIDLRSHHWVPRQQAANPKTMEQIQMEVEMEQFNKSSSYMNYPSQKDDRPGNMNKRGGSKSANSEEGWSLAASRNTRMKQPPYTVDAGKLKGIKRLSEISLQPTTNASWSRGSNISNTSKKNETLSSHKSSSGIPSGNRKNSTETSNMYLALDSINSDNSSVGSGAETSSSKGNAYRKGASVERSTFNLLPSSETAKKISKILTEIQSDDLYENLYEIIRKQFSKSELPLAIQELILSGFNFRKLKYMQAIGRATGKFVEDKSISIDELVKIISECVSKLTDIFQKGSDIWDVVSKYIWAHRSIHNITLWEVHTAFIELINKGMGYDLLLALFIDKYKESNENYIKDLWEEVKRMELIDWMTRTNVPQFLEKVPLDFLTYKEEKQMTQEAACSYMLNMMRENVNRDTITDWIRKNIGEYVKEAWFIRALTEAVYTFTVKPQESMQPRLDEAGFDRLKIYYPLLVNYVGNHAELELQCLFAIQRLIHKLEHPPGLTNNIFEHLWDCGQVVSTDGFLAWEANTDPHESEGKGVMVVSLTSFFMAMKTVDEESDGATTSVMEDEY